MEKFGEIWKSFRPHTMHSVIKGRYGAECPKKMPKRCDLIGRLTLWFCGNGENYELFGNVNFETL